MPDSSTPDPCHAPAAAGVVRADRNPLKRRSESVLGGPSAVECARRAWVRDVLGRDYELPLDDTIGLVPSVEPPGQVAAIALVIETSPGHLEGFDEVRGRVLDGR